MRFNKLYATALADYTALAADLQAKSSELDVSQKSQIQLSITHCRNHASAAVGAGTEYRVQTNERATGTQGWRTVLSYVADIAAPTAVAVSATPAATDTVIACHGATPFTVNQVIFFLNSTIANSEISTVVARDATGGSENFTVLDALTNAQAATTYYSGVETPVMVLDVRGMQRLRVVVNNANGTTNRAIVYRIAVITE
jgi:hypothetical protein